MEKLSKVEGIAAVIDLVNIDTDMIIPKQFLKTIKRSGLGKYAFYEMRYNEDESLKEEFILNDCHFKNASVIIAGDNFGCGSSREHAAWALNDFGIKAVISTSYSDIFFNNCFNNSICPVIVGQDDLEEMMSIAKNKETSDIVVDVANLKIIFNGKEYFFELEEALQKRLVNGLDHVGLTLEHEKDISMFEEKDKINRPWIYLNKVKN